MPAPHISQYLEALAAPVFRTLTEVQVVPGAIISGRNAVIFKVITGQGETKVLKCFLRSPQSPAEIYGYVGMLTTSCLSRMRWLPGEFWVFDRQGRGAWHDVALGDWVDGTTLETLLRRALATGDTQLLGRLAAGFDELACTLLREPWAHGDLKPENIIVSDDLRMVLVDHDAMFIPALAGRQSRELGTTPWQHPARDSRFYDVHLDDYPIAMLAVSLHALARWPELHDDGDRLLFEPAQIVDGQSPLWDELLGRWQRLGEQRLCLLLRLLASPSPRLTDLPQIMHAGSADVDAGRLEMFIERGKWGYRDAATGAVAIWPQYERAFAFSDDRAAVRLGQTWHFIDAGNHIVINGCDWQQVKPFHEGLAAVQVDEKWGYIDPAGKWVIEPMFQQAWNFCDGRARVIQGGEECFVARKEDWNST